MHRVDAALALELYYAKGFGVMDSLLDDIRERYEDFDIGETACACYGFSRPCSCKQGSTNEQLASAVADVLLLLDACEDLRGRNHELQIEAIRSRPTPYI